VSEELADHYNRIIASMKRRNLVPFLGSGANLGSRPPGIGPWEPDGQYLPDGEELAEYLALNFGYPKDEATDLVRVAQYTSVKLGMADLYEELHHLFNADFRPTTLHQFLARAPKIFRDKGYGLWPELVVTTNYDDVLERAFREEGELFDIVFYMAVGDNRGKFVHIPADGEPIPILEPNSYRGLLDETGKLSRPVVLKIHGAVNRSTPERDSFVITEDDYIDYLPHTDISGFIPVPLPDKLKNSHFLFLGYSLRDWNLRVILHRVWGQQPLSRVSWAIQYKPGGLDPKFWDKRNVEILDVSLDDYVAGLVERVAAIPDRTVASGV
jgi:hypothetical protein